MEDLYEILGVPRDASQAEIKKAYRKLVMQYHPDAHPGDKEAEEKFKKINAAYSVLENEEKRAKYDRFGTTGNSGDPFGGMGGMGVDLGDLFGDLFSQVFGGGGMGGRRQADPNAPRRGRDIEMVVKISLIDAAKGVKKDIEVPRLDRCKTCNGTGAKSGTKPETCQTCHGSGRVRQVQQSFLGQFVTETTCPHCNGTGKIIKEKCPDCQGSGQVHKVHKLEVKIPAGVNRGTRVCVRGEGEEGLNGGSNGDLYLVTDVANDKNFERDGADLHTPLILTYPQAVLGSEAVTVKTLIDGDAKISVPAGTSHGQVLKVKGRGMPKLNRPNSRGDLYAHVFIDIPTKLTDKQKGLITELAKEMDAPVGTNEQGFFDKVKNLFK